MRFGEKLSFLRKQRGITQMELAEKLDLSRQAVSRWEQGVSEPSTKNLVSIGKLFDISVDALVNENVQLQPESSVHVAVVEEKETIEKYSRYSVVKFVGILIFMIVVVLTVFIEMRAGKEGAPEQNPIDVENLEKEMIDVDNIDTDKLLLELID